MFKKLWENIDIISLAVKVWFRGMKWGDAMVYSEYLIKRNWK